MVEDVLALQVVELFSLQLKSVRHREHLHPREEQAEKHLVKDLFILGKLVLHHRIENKHNVLFVQFSLVAVEAVIRHLLVERVLLSFVDGHRSVLQGWQTCLCLHL